MEEQKPQIQTVKYAPPPSALPVLGKVEPTEVSFIGRTNYAAALEEKKFVFGIKRVDRRRHLYVIGKAGVGKSKLIELLARQDIACGRGLCVIDPYGDIIEAILNFIPRERAEDICVIDPTDANFPASFNPLANVDPALKHQVAQEFIEVMEKQFGANWTPHLEHIFRLAMLALLDYPGATIRDMISILTDAAFRKNVIPQIQDELVRRFWDLEFTAWVEKFDADAIIPLVNKLSQFLFDPILRNIFGQKENKIDLGRLIDEQKIILINLAKGRLGEESSSFLGSIFIAKIKQAGAERASIAGKTHKDFYVYLDEFQGIATTTFENLLSDARKYGFCLTLSHQYMSQLTPKVQSSILGNVGSLIVFRVGGDDARVLEAELAPIFKIKDMINLGTQEFYIKLIIDGQSYDPFSAETLKVLPPNHPSNREAILMASRNKYSMPLK